MAFNGVDFAIDFIVFSFEISIAGFGDIKVETEVICTCACESPPIAVSIQCFVEVHSFSFVCLSKPTIYFTDNLFNLLIISV